MKTGNWDEPNFKLTNVSICYSWIGKYPFCQNITFDRQLTQNYCSFYFNKGLTCPPFGINYLDVWRIAVAR